MRLLRMAALLAVLCGSAQALAQNAAEVGEGRISALVFQPLDRSRPIAVRLMDDSEDNKALKAAFERELARAGFRVLPEADQVLTFETTTSLPGTAAQRPGVVQLGGTAASTGEDSVTAKVKLFSTGEDSLFKRRPEEGPQGTAGSFRLDTTLIDRTAGKRIWQGWAISPAYNSDGQTTSLNLIPALVNQIGQPARNVPVPLRLP